ncbi:MAG: RNA methyltransferase [Cyanobacteria bacterium P01_G01_bin.38]
MPPNLRIILVEPAGPLNVGAIARVMKNFGLTRLVLVNPQCDPLGAEATQMAVHAKDVLTQARITQTLPEALVGCQRAIATTARPRELGDPLELPETALPWLVEANNINTALIFGREDRGLSNDELYQAQRFIKVPTDAGYAALNLAQAVAICCYELARVNAPSPPLPPAPSSQPPLSLRNAPPSAKQSASLDDLDGYYHHLESVLLSIGYLYPHTAPSRMRKLRRLLHRATPSAQEVALLRGILRQIEWATRQVNSGSPRD